MFSEVDRSLRALLIADVPLDPGEVDVSFDRPTREWSNKLTRPTVNLFLIDIRERTELRDQTLDVRPSPNGSAQTKRRPRRIDLTYVITAWANDAGDEHRLLSAVLGTMFRVHEMPVEHLNGQLSDADYPVMLRIMPPDFHISAADLWSVLDNELHASLTWVVTAPLDVFAPTEWPLVRTQELGYFAIGEEWRERFPQIGGTVQRAGGEVVAGARVEIVGTALRTRTDEQGRFRFGGIAHGRYTFRVEADGQEASETEMEVPADSYTIQV